MSGTLSLTGMEALAKTLSQKHGIRVVCAGDKCCTDGKTIYLPDIPASINNPRLLGLVRSYLDHEVGHIVGKTDTAPMIDLQRQGDKPMAAMLNTVEDIRTDGVMSRLWAGCGLNIAKGIDVIRDRIDEAYAKNAEGFDPLKQLTMAVYFTGKGLSCPKWIDADTVRIVEGYGNRLKALASDKSATTADALQLAQEIWMEFEDFQNNQQQQQGQQGQSDSQQQSDSSGQGSGKSKGQNGKGESKDSSDSKSSSASDSQGESDTASDIAGDDGSVDADDDAEGESDSGKSEPEQDTASEGDGAEDESDGDTEPSEGEDDAGDSSDDADSGDSDPTEDDDPSGDEGSDASGTSMNGSGGSHAKGGDPAEGKAKIDFSKMDGADLTQLLADAVDDEVKGELQKKDDPAMSIRFLPGLDKWIDWKTAIQDRFYADRAGKSSEEFIAESKRIAGSSANRLQRVLMAEAKVSWRTGLKKGMPDPRQLAKLAVGVKCHPMRKRVDDDSPDTACSLLLDGSGSMAGAAMYQAALAATIFARVMDLCKVKTRMSLFTGGIVQNLNAMSKAMGITKEECELWLRAAGNTRAFGLELVEIKPWNTSYRKVEKDLHLVSRFGTGGTPLGEAIQSLCEDMLPRSESRKIVMAFTDGGPNEETLTTNVCKHYEKRGIEVVLVGIGYRVEHLHYRTAYCDKIKDLSTVLMTAMQKALGH